MNKCLRTKHGRIATFVGKKKNLNPIKDTEKWPGNWKKNPESMISPKPMEERSSKKQ